MSPTKPPSQARAGQIRARGNTVNAMPLRAMVPPTLAKELAPSPLLVLRPPSALCAPIEMSLRQLDRGRLHAPGLVDALGWEFGAQLEVELTRRCRLRLRLRSRHIEPVGRVCAHVDGRGRIVMTAGLLAWLVVRTDGPVLVWAEQDGAGQATGVLAVANPGAVEQAFVSLCAAEDASKISTFPERQSTAG